MAKLALDPGHGGEDPGAVFGDLKEKTICLAIAKETARLCALNGHIPILTRTMDEFVSLDDRCEIANSWEADFFLSIHCNADPDPDEPGMPEATGSEIFIFPGSKARRFAEKTVLAIQRFFPGRKFRGIKTAGFAVLRYTKMPAALVEVAFIDTQESVKLAHWQTQKKIAEALAWAINSYSEEVGL